MAKAGTTCVGFWLPTRLVEAVDDMRRKPLESRTRTSMVEVLLWEAIEVRRMTPMEPRYKMVVDDEPPASPPLHGGPEPCPGPQAIDVSKLDERWDEES